jgi:hypothetical protein
MDILGLEDGPMSRFSHKKSDLGISGDFWGDGADSAQKLDSLTG